MSRKVGPLQALRRGARRECYQCEVHKPYKQIRREGEPYIHLRMGRMATSLYPGDLCRSQEIWRVYEELGGRIENFDTRKPKFEQFIPGGYPD